MSDNMKKYAEEENAKPPFFYRDGQIYKRGNTTYNAEKGTCSQGLHVCVCVVSEYMDDENEAGEYICKALIAYSEEIIEDADEATQKLIDAADTVIEVKKGQG